jgi:proteasome accessory factor B
VIVKFPYLKPGQSEAKQREVIPLALLQYQGRWHLAAEEPDTGIRKNFLLRRIVGPVKHGKAGPVPEGDVYAETIAGLERVWEEGVAEVEVTDGTDAARRLARRRGSVAIEGGAPGTGRLRLHWVDLAILADELAAFGPEVLVISPQDLRDAVRERLERTAADHG